MNHTASRYFLGALFLGAVCATGTTARSKEPPDAERATSPRSPADAEPRGAPEGTLLVCRQVTTSKCDGVVEIPAVTGDEPRIEDSRWRTAAERRTARVVQHGPDAAPPRPAKLRRAPMQNGFEPEPLLGPELKREILVFLAEVTGERSLRRAGTKLPAISTIRAIAEMDALERARVRATYVQTEDFKGVERSVTTRPALIAGYALLGSGVVIHRLSDVPDKPEMVAIRPQPWPPGIRIQGRFNWP